MLLKTNDKNWESRIVFDKRLQRHIEWQIPHVTIVFGAEIDMKKGVSETEISIGMWES